MRRTRRILDYHYEKSDLSKVTSESKHLTEEERAALHTLLTKYELLFGGTLFTWEMKPVDIELQTDAKPYHEKPCPVPREHEETFKK